MRTPMSRGGGRADRGGRSGSRGPGGRGPRRAPVGPRGPPKKGRGTGMKGGNKVVIEAHRHEGVFIAEEAVFADEVKNLQAEQCKPREQVTLEPFERDHACVVGAYRVPKKQKPAA